MYLEDFCEKDVISICDCKKLGRVYNLEFDECTGCIKQLVVKDKGFFGSLFSVSDETVIPYGKIKQIGEDIILVDV